MDLLRFHSAQRYVSKGPLQELSFCVRVWRAPLVEVHHTEMLCSVTVPWDGKIFSPAEKLEMVREAAEAGSGNGPLTDGDGDEGVEMEAVQTVLRGRDDTVRSTAATARELQEHLEKTASAFFTRPSSEDYINEAEEDCPVDPFQYPSPLAAVVLRQHRAQHQASNKMYFMWAVGGIVAPKADSLADMRWDGEERVICTITADRSDTFFTAKPSINETHTLFVDSLHVYSFKITIAATEEMDSAQPSPGDLLRKISKLAASVKDRLSAPHAARRDALQRMLLRQAIVIGSEGVKTAPDTTAAVGSSPFEQPPPEGRVRYHVLGTVDRCLGVAEDALCLRCEWYRSVPQGEEEAGKEEGEQDKNEEEAIGGLTTQLAFAGSIILENFIPLPVHTFNAPFELHFDDAVNAPPLRLIVTVYSDSPEGQQAPVGYTALEVPHMLPGRHSLRGPLWRPRMTGREFLRSALAGGAPSLVDTRDVGPRGAGGISVKHGLVTEPAGELEVSVIVLHHCQTSS